jgi:hypothetical protein
MWISHILYTGADGRLRALYDRIEGSDYNVGRYPRLLLAGQLERPG